MIHYTDPYLLNPGHKVTVKLIGLGGTGSRVLTLLGQLNEALIGLGHPGIHVYCYDADTVSTANIGRQIFSPADIGQNKAVCLVTRINRFFGLNWEAIPEMHVLGHNNSNITISCVDSAKSRLDIDYAIRKGPQSVEPNLKARYWLDLGNSQKTGQVVLGSCGHIPQPKKTTDTVSKLKNVVEYFPQLKKIKEKDQGPSCSMAEALQKQDLYINSTLAHLGLAIIWKLFREGRIEQQGLYLNLDTLIVNPIKIKA